MTEALSRIFDAHGGLEYWRSLSSMDVEISAWGFLFTVKRITPQRHARLTISTREPHVVLHDYPADGQSAVVLGGERVEIHERRRLSGRGPGQPARRPSAAGGCYVGMQSISRTSAATPCGTT